MYFVGLDVHARRSSLCIVDEGGRTVNRLEVRGAWPKLLQEVASSVPRPFAVCYEASCGYGYLHERLARLADAEPGLLLEVKTGSIALHYRRRPDLERNCLEAVEKAIADLHGLETLRGKMVVEIKAGRSNKGDAIADFMKETPFRGRVPIFAGDDVTDEDAFREIARLSGLSIKIGSGDTSAGYRARGTAQFHQWLNDMASAFDSGRRVG
jgi:trehalose 6-phosphate phosphatase